MPMNAEDLLSRTLKLLQGATRVSGFSQTDLDDAIGRRRGYLSHVFQRRVDLKVGDLFRALEALDIDPCRFFDAVSRSTSDAQPTLDELLRLAATGNRRPPAPSPPADPFRPAPGVAEDAELYARVQEAVREILAGAKALS